MWLSYLVESNFLPLINLAVPKYPHVECQHRPHRPAHLAAEIQQSSLWRWLVPPHPHFGKEVSGHAPVVVAVKVFGLFLVYRSDIGRVTVPSVCDIWWIYF